MKFKTRSLWPSCLGGATLSDAPGSRTTLKILTADGQVLRFPELCSMTVADLLAYTAHPHHMVCEGNPKDFLLHHSRLTKLSSALNLDDDSAYDTESTSDRSETNSFTASPARRSFGSLSSASSIVGLSPLTRMPSFGSPMVKRFFLGGGAGAGAGAGAGGGFLGSPIQRLRSFGRRSTTSSPRQQQHQQQHATVRRGRATTSTSPGGETHHGYGGGGGMSPLQMSRNAALSDLESEVGSEDGSCCDFQPPKFERGRILSLDTELDSGRVYYLVPLPRLLPDNSTDSAADPSLACGHLYPAAPNKCSCLKASTAKRLQLESKKSSKHSRPAICGSMRCNKSHGLVIMGSTSTNGSSKINPQDSEWESDFSGEMSKRGASTIHHSGELWRGGEDSKRPSSASAYSLPPPHMWGGRFPNALAAYRSDEELLRDEIAAKVARAQYRIPPAYCFRNPWKLDLPIIIEGMVAVVHNDKKGSTSRSRSRNSTRDTRAKDNGGRKDNPRSPEMHYWPSVFPAPPPPHSPGLLRSNRSPGRRQILSPGSRRKSPTGTAIGFGIGIGVYQPQSVSPHSPSLSSSSHHQSPIRYARTSPHTRLLERQLTDSPLHLPAISPDHRFQGIPPKFQLSSPDRSPARYAGGGVHGQALPILHLTTSSSPERSSFRHNNLNPPSYRQTHPAYTSYRHMETFRLAEPPSPAQRPVQLPEHYYYQPASSSYSYRSGIDSASSHTSFRSSIGSQQQQLHHQPWESPPSGVNFFISGKSWQICSPQRSSDSPSLGRARSWKSVPASPASHLRGPESPSQGLALGRDVFTPSSPAWPNPAPRSSEPPTTSRDMLNAAQLGMVQQGSNGRFRSSPAWRDVRQISSGRPGGGHVEWGSPGHNGIFRSSSPAYAGYGGPTW